MLSYRLFIPYFWRSLSYDPTLHESIQTVDSVSVRHIFSPSFNVRTFTVFSYTECTGDSWGYFLKPYALQRLSPSRYCQRVMSTDFPRFHNHISMVSGSLTPTCSAVKRIEVKYTRFHRLMCFFLNFFASQFIYIASIIISISI